MAALSETVEAFDLTAAAPAAALGSASKVTVIAKLGPEQPPAVPAPEPEGVLVELWSVTSETPSISRRRCIAWATVRCEVAQPAIEKVGTLPAGVAELTGEAVVALEAGTAPVEEVAVELAGGVDVEDAVVVDDADGAVAGAAVVLVAAPAAMVPSSELIDTSLVRTRPNS
ncbi:MAG TPA: hypothetical protein VF927_02350, partial [Solirubrobacteraceae bacterium]